MVTQPAFRIGLFGIGLAAYWPQFRGLKERLEGYLGQVEGRLKRMGAEVVCAGLVDSPERAMDSGHLFRSSDVDIIFLYVTTYALSSTVLPVVRRAKVPVVILNLQPTKAIGYGSFNEMGDVGEMTGEWLAYCSACPVPEIANVFRRARIPFNQVTGCLDGDPLVWSEVESWVEATRVATVMEHNRMGVMGHYYGGMLDIYTDLTQQCAHFGGHFELIEVEELVALRRAASAHEVEDRVAVIREMFAVEPACPAGDLAECARTSVALDRLVDQHRLGSMAYFYKGTGNPDHELAISSIIVGTSMLTGRDIPVAGEMEIKNAQAMKIMAAFGCGGSFTEYYAIDFNEDVVIMGHDGPGHIAIAEGKTRVRPLRVYHGKVGRGLSVEMSVRRGPVTLLSVLETADGRLELLVAEGESVPGPILEIGNTNSRYRFKVGARQFVESWNARGPAHHCAVGIGHIADRIRKLGVLLNIAVHAVC